MSISAVVPSHVFDASESGSVHVALADRLPVYRPGRNADAVDQGESEAASRESCKSDPAVLILPVVMIALHTKPVLRECSQPHVSNRESSVARASTNKRAGSKSLSAVNLEMAKQGAAAKRVDFAPPSVGNLGVTGRDGTFERADLASAPAVDGGNMKASVVHRADSALPSSHDLGAAADAITVQRTEPSSQALAKPEASSQVALDRAEPTGNAPDGVAPMRWTPMDSSNERMEKSLSERSVPAGLRAAAQAAIPVNATMSRTGTEVSYSFQTWGQGHQVTAFLAQNETTLLPSSPRVEAALQAAIADGKSAFGDGAAVEQWNMTRQEADEDRKSRQVAWWEEEHD